MIGSILTGVVAAIHVYIVVLEMVLWDTERGRKAFGMKIWPAGMSTEDFPKDGAIVIAQNIPAKPIPVA